jgi:hypothetical protein
VLALLEPVVLEHAAEEGIELLLRVVLHRIHVVALGHPLDVQGGDEDAQRRVIEDGRSDLLGRSDHPTGRTKPLLELLPEPLEELDVLRLLLGEVKECPPLVSVSTDAMAHVVDQRRHDVLLHQAEEVQVGEPPDLIQRPLLLGVQTANRTQAGEGLRQEGPGEVQRPSPDDLLELPVDLLRRLQH